MTIPLNPMQVNPRLFTNVTPFTVRDNATMLTVIEEMRWYINQTLVPFVNDNTNEVSDKVNELIESWNMQSAALIEQVEEIAAGVGDSVSDAQAAQAAAEAAAALAEQFASQAEEIQDVAITAIFNDAESAFRTAANGVFLTSADIEDFAEKTYVDSELDPIKTEINDGRLSVAGLQGRHPVYRLWSGLAYPTRIEGAVNIFFGPADPGLLMEDGDFWADPATVSLADFVAALNNPSTDAYAAVKAISVLDSFFVPAASLTTVGDAVMVTQGASPNMRASITMPEGVVSRVVSTVEIPNGWNTYKLEIFWYHTASSPTPGNVHFVVATNPTTTFDNGSTHSVFSPAVDANVSTSILSNWFTGSEGSLQTFIITRNGTGVNDTWDGGVQLLGVKVTRES